MTDGGEPMSGGKNGRFFAVPEALKARRMPRVVRELVEYWNEQEGVRKLRLTQETKVLQRSITRVEALLNGCSWRGTKFAKNARVFSPSEIKHSFREFSEYVTSYDCSDSSKRFLKNIAIAEFIYDEISGTSKFLEFLPSREVELERCIADEMESVSGIDKNDMSKLMLKRAALELSKFRDKWEDRIMFFSISGNTNTPEFWARVAVESVRSIFRSVSLGNLTSPITYNKFLPDFLGKRGMLSSTLLDAERRGEVVNEHLSRLASSYEE